MDSLVRFLLFALVAGAVLCCSARADVLELNADGAAAMHADSRPESTAGWNAHSHRPADLNSQQETP
jgi:hypothetical protein